MHQNEQWQEFNQAGERLTSSRTPEQGNPKLDEKVFVATAGTWLFRRGEKGIEILFQQRSPYVDHHANLWDRSAGGHVNFGEDIAAAAARELREEIGAEISPAELNFVTSYASNFSNAFINIFVFDYTDKQAEFHFDDREVSEVKWVPLSEIDDFIANFAKPPLKEDVESLSHLKKWFEKRGNL